MNHFKMSMTEKDILADIGKLSYFLWRTQGQRYGEFSDDLKFEYEHIAKHYKLSVVSFPHSQIKRFLKSIYARLNNDQKSLERHWPIECTAYKGVITSIKCGCGELTKYQVPLKLISDFQCPKEERRHDSN